MSSLTNSISQTVHKYPKLFALLVISAAGLITFSNSFTNSFHFDDIVGVVRNPAIRDLINIPAYFTDPSTFGLGRTREWRPILQITYAINYAIGGYNPVVFRTFNLLVHIASAYLIFLIITVICERSPIQTGLPWRVPPILAGVLAGLLFAVHTVNSEAVDYIWARSSLLATFFLLLAFYCYLRGPFGKEKENRWLWSLAGFASYALGVGTKATAITLPGMLFLYELLFLNPASKNPLRLFFTEPRRLIKHLPAVIVLVGYFAVRLLLLPRMFSSLVTASPSTAPIPVITSYSYLITQFRAWVYYFRLFLWPEPLLVDYPGFGWSRSIWDARVLVSLALIITVLVFAWLVRKSQPLVSFFLLWYFVALLPEASFIPLAEAVVGYRAYPAYVGLAVVSVMLSLWGAMKCWQLLRKQTKEPDRLFWWTYGFIAAALLISLTEGTIVRNRVWRNETTLWTDVMNKDPANPRPYMSLGLESLIHGNYGKAQNFFDKAIQVSPRSSHAHILRGYLNFRLDRSEQALADFASALALDPRSPYAFFYRGELYRKLGKTDQALADYRASLRLMPYYTDAQLGTAMAYLDKEDIVKATESCQKLVDIDPNDRRGYDCLGTLLIEQNRFSDAARLYKLGVDRIPKDRDLWNSLGKVYETLGLHNEANDAFERVRRLTADPSRQSPNVTPLVE